ncbi:pyridoxal phosphate-dependent decarboxylase family protein [Streptomyces sp. NPDC088348]|uniref:pyridoxal phosphate-dependent decarboxylase family protein n=1 Tax=Streptomyces sp. NPDC088348 TaxID=3365853 RepID=UPI003800EC48
MYPRLASDLSRLPQLLADSAAFAVRELGSLPARPVAWTGQAPTADPLPREGVGAEAALARFAERWAPGFSGSAGPRYLGFVTGGTTPAALVGDWLTGTYDQNAMTGGDSSATALERETIAWLRELFGIGEAHDGVFVTGATASNTVGLATAREWAGERLGVRVSRDGVGALGPLPVLSGAPHSSIAKALSVLGLGRSALVPVPLLPGGREAVDPRRLEEELRARAGRPSVVVANAGTVNTVDFDDLGAIAALRQRYDFWLHVDAAFGGFAALSPRHADLVRHLDAADSVCLDLHKWLNVPYDAALAFTRHRELQVRVHQNAASYLSAPVGEPDFLHLAPENSRRLRAVAAWFTLTAYGRDGYREIVERCTALAGRLAAGLGSTAELRLAAPTRLNVVCFTLAHRPTPERVQALARAIAETGETFVTPTVLFGQPVLRAALSNWSTTEADVDRVVRVVSEVSRGFA